MAVYISLTALLVSVVTLCWTVWCNLKQQQSLAVTSCLGSIAQIELKLAEIPRALEFHGIGVDELKAAGISPEEFAYLLASFTAGGLYYRLKREDPLVPFPSGSYRHTMLSSPMTRAAWPFLRKCLSASPYLEKLEATLSRMQDDCARGSANAVTRAGTPEA